MLERTAELRVALRPVLGELRLGFFVQAGQGRPCPGFEAWNGRPLSMAVAPSEYPGALREKERDTERQRDREGYIAVRVSRFNQLRCDRSTSTGGMMFHPPPNLSTPTSYYEVGSIERPDRCRQSSA